MDKIDRDIIDIIEDYTRMRDTIDWIACSIENGLPMPNYIPIMNDSLLSDLLGKICEHINDLHKKLL